MFEKWLVELKDEVVVVCASELNEEANENMLSFRINENDVDEWGVESIRNFVLGCMDIYASKKTKIPMIFYSWFDEQSGQLRISMVSSSHNKLPFRSKIQECELNEVLSDMYSPKGALFFLKNKLKVWCTQI